jgi:hypothetical protein
MEVDCIREEGAALIPGISSAIENLRLLGQPCHPGLYYIFQGLPSIPGRPKVLLQEEVLIL